MPNRHAPRREPRILAISHRHGILRSILVDLFEIRASQETRATDSALRTTIRLLVLREKPTLVVADPTMIEQFAKSPVKNGPPWLPVVQPKGASVPLESMYPEAPLFAPTYSLQQLLHCAIHALLYSPHPPRRYANQRRSPTTR